MLFIFLSVSLFFKTINDINKIKMGEFNKNYKFSLAKESKIEESNYIKSISNYSFFYNIKSKKMIVLPNASIEKIEILDVNAS